MSWMLIVGISWALLSVPLGLLIGRSIRLCDERESAQSQPAVPDFVPAGWTVLSADSQ